MRISTTEFALMRKHLLTTMPLSRRNERKYD